MTMKRPFSFLIVTIIFTTLTAPLAKAATPPNVVIILTDDQGYADLSHNPNHAKEVFTPNMDLLAKEGVFFTQAYTSGAVCSPTRAGLMLGRYQQRVGIYTAGDGGRGFNPSTPIFPSFLPNGYRSSVIGKWHLGLDDDYPELKWHALNRGFSECYKFMGRGGHDYFELKGVKGDNYQPIYRNKERIKPSDYSGYLTTRLTEEAILFIKQAAAKPFFLYLAYNAVHAPAQAPAADIERIESRFPQLTKKRATVMAMLQHLDQGVGQVMSTLKETQTWDNTLLFFLTDNGGSRAMEANNGALRGFKGSLYEGGIRTPLIVSWPNRFKGGRQIDTPVISLDLLPTVIEATNMPTTNSHQLDGKSLLPMLTNEKSDHHSTLHWASGGPKGEWAIRMKDWKLHGTKEQSELYHLPSDPSEKTDLSKNHPDVARDLFGRQTAWKTAVMASAKAYQMNGEN
ncbi:sulfatase-like hydrolase/transferase [bacterium]|jgi:arylsulfatase A-like enzyme|nr:sulfatase-like hydrolase/transferase [bacterium]